MGKLGCGFNYTGSKIRHKKVIDNILPKEDNIKVLDLFYGGGSLTSAFNKTWSITANDFESRIIAIHRLFKEAGLPPEKLVSDLVKFEGTYIKGKHDKDGYLTAKDAYNSMDDTFMGSPNLVKIALLYVLLCSSFSNQVRWCDKGKWNMPHGKRHFNNNMQKNLLQYITNILTRDITFTSLDFRSFDLSKWDLVISDSPYLKTTAGYNEKGRWTLKDSVNLLTKLDKYHNKGGKFIMFEESWSKGVENKLITDWMSKYNVTALGDSSSGSNYQRKGGKTCEVIIYNF